MENKGQAALKTLVDTGYRLNLWPRPGIGAQSVRLVSKYADGMGNPLYSVLTRRSRNGQFTIELSEFPEAEFGDAVTYWLKSAMPFAANETVKGALRALLGSGWNLYIDHEELPPPTLKFEHVMGAAYGSCYSVYLGSFHRRAEFTTADGAAYAGHERSNYSAAPESFDEAFSVWAHLVNELADICVRISQPA